MKKITNYILLFFCITTFYSCEQDITEESNMFTLKFKHLCNGTPVVFDTLIYTNAAGNPYMIRNINWFISEIRLLEEATTDPNSVNENNSFSFGRIILYADAKSDIYNKARFADIDGGNFKAIMFTFGLPDKENISDRYPEPPRCDMAIPKDAGGGYHYMKLDAEWLSENDTLKPMNFYLGRGPIYDQGNVVGTVDNSFRVIIPVHFTIDNSNSPVIQITMNVEDWFRNPNIINFDTYGEEIMFNQSAIRAACENGTDVFSISK